ncbi:MAG: hypothetical protein ACJA2Q_000575 [Pseudohongiellaceae bacterium]|jgi:hypothetical protein
MPIACVAQDDFFTSIDVDIAETQSSDYSVIGWITQNASYGIEEPSQLFSRTDSELNGLQTSLYIQADGKLSEKSNFRISGKYYHDPIYQLKSDVPHSKEERDQLRNRLEVRDFYIDYQADNGFYFKVGNQILAWGLSEYVRVTDQINVEDQFAIAQQDLEDLRLPAPAALMSYRFNDWLLDTVVTYDADRNQIAPEGDEFDQFARLRNNRFALNRQDTKNMTEGFVRLSTQLSSGDLQIVAGEFNDNNLSVDNITAVQSSEPSVNFNQNRMRMIGAAVNWVEGAWLFYGEVGALYDVAVRPNAQSFFGQVNGWDQKDQTLAVAGIEYNGFSNLLLSLEIDSIHTQDHDSFMLAPVDQISVGARFNWSALNERLRVVGVWNKLANNWGRVSRLSIDYNWSDNLDLSFLWVDYNASSDSVFYAFRNNDVVQLQMRYNFQL